MLPEGCGECQRCGQPMLGSGLCPNCWESDIPCSGNCGYKIGRGEKFTRDGDKFFCEDCSIDRLPWQTMDDDVEWALMEELGLLDGK